MTTLEQGAKIQAFARQPSIDLAALIDPLGEAIDPGLAPPHEKGTRESINLKSQSLFFYHPDRNRLHICISAVLWRLFNESYRDG